MSRMTCAALLSLLVMFGFLWFFIYKSYISGRSLEALQLSSDILAEIVSDFDNINIILTEENEQLKKDLEECRSLLNMAIPVRVTLTCYNSEEAQTDSTPFITAFNWKVRPGIIAVSIDLLEMGYVPGSKVYIKNFGVYTVGDIMNDRFSNRVDMWIPKGRQVFKHDNVLMVPIVEGDTV